MTPLSLLKHLGLAAAGMAVLVAPFVLPQIARGEGLAGPVSAYVLRVIDGDTIEVVARIWLNQDLTTSVRIAGIDAPESGGRAQCDDERAKAREAKAFLEALVLAREVLLTEIADDKYGGRVDARVAIIDEAGAESDLGERLLSEGLAVPYGDPSPWCPAAWPSIGARLGGACTAKPRGSRSGSSLKACNAGDEPPIEQEMADHFLDNGCDDRHQNGSQQLGCQAAETQRTLTHQHV